MIRDGLIDYHILIHKHGILNGYYFYLRKYCNCNVRVCYYIELELVNGYCCGVGIVGCVGGSKRMSGGVRINTGILGNLESGGGLGWLGGAGGWR